MKRLAVILALLTGASFLWAQTDCGNTSSGGAGGTTGADIQFAYQLCTVPASGVTGAVTSGCIYNNATLTGTNDAVLGIWENNGSGGIAGTVVCGSTAITLSNSPGWNCGAFSSCTLTLGSSYILGWNSSSATFAVPAVCATGSPKGDYQTSVAYPSLITFTSPNTVCSSGQTAVASEYIVLQNTGTPSSNHASMF